jgi:hypothetical protein
MNGGEMSTPPDGPTGDPDGPELVRALLGEVGREPEPLPDDVADRLDDVLAGLVAERAGTATRPADSPAVVPLDRARRRRRRGAQVLVAAAAVVVGGWTVSNLDLGSGTSGDDASGSGGGSAAPQAGGSSAAEQSFTLSSGSLRADARRLVAADVADLDSGADAPQAGAKPLDDTDGIHATQDTHGTGRLERQDGPATGSRVGGLAGVPTRAAASQRADGSCLDPPVPTGLTRLAVAYDGAPATAVLRPAGPATSGAPRVRVEVWACSSPVRLAAVVVRR